MRGHLTSLIWSRTQSPVVQTRAVSVIPNVIIREHPRDNVEQTAHY